MNIVARSESINLVVLVLPNAFNQVAADSYIQRAITLAGENINNWLHSLILLDSRLRGNDGVNGKMRDYLKWWRSNVRHPQ